METLLQRNILDSRQERRHSLPSSTTAVSMNLGARAVSDDMKYNQGGVRSRGWVPLSFPRSALVQQNATGFHSRSTTSFSTTMNRYFPLHEDVVLATVRELLLLDGTIDPTTLKVRHVPTKILRVSVERDGSERRCESCECLLDAPRYWCHMDPSHWKLAPETRNTAVRKGTKRQKKPEGASRKRKKLDKGLSSNPKQMTAAEGLMRNPVNEERDIEKWMPPVLISSMDEQPDLVDEDVLQRIDATPSAECLAEMIASRCYSTDNPVSLEVMQRDRESHLESNLHLNDVVDDDDERRRPRKVSDVDQEAVHSSLKDSTTVAFRITDDVVGNLDLARFINLSERAVDGTFALKQNDLPALLEASIATESLLRDEAIRMTTAMTKSFSDSTFRLFLGYKAPTLKRDRLIQVLADFLFDASHAMFAWDQTVEELLNTKSLKEPLSSKQWTELDNTVKNYLFDDRALRKIGGFEPSSVLPHAISISRLRVRGINWEAFAKTADGKRMLAHHRSGGDHLLVGQKRRGQRQRHRTLIPSEPSADKTQRARCSSIGSADVDGLVSDDSVPESPFFADVPSTAQVHLAREEGSSWGILLSREGDMCVVARAGGSDETKKSGEIRCGDMILRCTNERGETACTPCAAGRQQQQEVGWFRNMVDMFKSSKELHLAIQRVGA